MKKFLIILLMALSIPAFAGEFDKAYSTGKKVLVYFYSPTCVTCNRFNPQFNDLKKNYKDIEFVRVNVETLEGAKMIRKYHGLYIPYLILTSSKTKKTVSVSLSCAMSDMCFERVIKDFKY